MKILELQKQNPPCKPGKSYSLEVHLELVTKSGSTNLNQDPGSQKVQRVLSGDQPVTLSEGKVIPPREDETSAVLAEVARGPTNFSAIKEVLTIKNGTDAIEATMTYTGTNDFVAVCGCVEKLMNIGDVVAGVSAPINGCWKMSSVII